MSVNIIRILREVSLCVLSLKFQIFFFFPAQGWHSFYDIWPGGRPDNLPWFWCFCILNIFLFCTQKITNIYFPILHISFFKKVSQPYEQRLLCILFRQVMTRTRNFNEIRDLKKKNNERERRREERMNWDSPDMVTPSLDTEWTFRWIRMY